MHRPPPTIPDSALRKLDSNLFTHAGHTDDDKLVAVPAGELKILLENYRAAHTLNEHASAVERRNTDLQQAIDTTHKRLDVLEVPRLDGGVTLAAPDRIDLILKERLRAAQRAPGDHRQRGGILRATARPGVAPGDPWPVDRGEARAQWPPQDDKTLQDCKERTPNFGGFPAGTEPVLPTATPTVPPKPVVGPFPSETRTLLDCVERRDTTIRNLLAIEESLRAEIGVLRADLVRLRNKDVPPGVRAEVDAIFARSCERVAITQDNAGHPSTIHGNTVDRVGSLHDANHSLAKALDDARADVKRLQQTAAVAHALLTEAGIANEEPTDDGKRKVRIGLVRRLELLQVKHAAQVTMCRDEEGNYLALKKEAVAIDAMLHAAKIPNTTNMPGPKHGGGLNRLLSREERVKIMWSRLESAEQRMEQAADDLMRSRERARQAEQLLARAKLQADPLGLSPGTEAIIAERGKQLAKWSPEHDDDHHDGALASAAAALAVLHTDARVVDPSTDAENTSDPWGLATKHPRTLARLRIAGALIAAEYDRIARVDPTR